MASLPLYPADLRPGLLVFFARPSLLQTWAELFGHEWRHVGITVETDFGLRVASYGPKKCFRLDDPSTIMNSYSRVGVAEAFSCDAQRFEFQRFCRSLQFLERSDSPYTVSCVVFGPIHLLARRRRQGGLRTAAFGLVQAYCAFQSWRYRDRSAYACSTFAWHALDVARPEPLRVPLSAHPDDLAAAATPSTRRDEQMARWLCGPTEIWHAIAEQDRIELELSEAPKPDTPGRPDRPASGSTRTSRRARCARQIAAVSTRVAHVVGYVIR